MTNLFSYVVPYDIGFAPNPFFGWCSLACCKPGIRAKARVGDIIVGTSSVAGGAEPKFIYVMRVTEISNFESYWDDQRFYRKRPNLRGSNKQIFGDNIYHKDPTTGQWIQEDSRHSELNGSIHSKHLERDTGRTEKVLLSNDFVYWGGERRTIPSFFRQKTSSKNIVKKGPGWKGNFSQCFIKEFEYWFDRIKDKGYQGKPTDWKESTLRTQVF